MNSKLGEVDLITVVGDSMLPTLKSRWKVEIVPKRPQEIRIGDIIISQKSGLSTCHRIIGKWTYKDNVNFLLKGDNSFFPERILEGQILGKVIEVRDEKLEKVKDDLWCRQNILLYLYNRLIYSLYRILLIFKKMLFGNKRNNLTALISTWYWFIVSSPISFLQKKSWSGQN